MTIQEKIDQERHFSNNFDKVANEGKGFLNAEKSLILTSLIGELSNEIMAYNGMTYNEHNLNRSSKYMIACLVDIIAHSIEWLQKLEGTEILFVKNEGEKTLSKEYIYNEITQEREFQDQKWGVQTHLSDYVWTTILVEEVGEAAQEVQKDKNSFEIIKLRDELIQVAAVAVAWAEALDKREENIEQQESIC